MKAKKNSYFAFLLSTILLISCSPENEFLYVGTVSQRGSQGIYVYKFNRNDFTFTLQQTLPEISSPGFLVIHPSGKYVFSINKTAGSEGPPLDAVTAFLRDEKTGELSVINQALTQGRGASHISLDKTGKWIFISHYGSGDMVVFPVNSNGEIGDVIQKIVYEGSSVTARQDRPHVHSILVSPDNKFVYVADLGTDKMMIYTLDQNTGKLSPAIQPFLSVNPGAGPRHFTFHPSKDFIYLADELSSSVTVLKRNVSDGSLEMVETLSTLPVDFDQLNTVADIHTDPDGNYLYVSNRGHNSLAIFKINASGRLEFLAHEPTQGAHPRNFMVDPNGEFLMVANRDTDNIVVFSLDNDTGILEDKGISLDVPASICLKWFR